MKQEDIIAALEVVKKSGITVNGDLVLEKKVDYEVANVENGGIGIQINHGLQGKNTEPTDEEQLDEHEEADTSTVEQEKPQEELNVFAPKKNLQELLKESWFRTVRTDEKYNAAWTDTFVEALMASEYGEGIARQWAVNGVRNKHNQLKGYVVGLLKDEGVLKGSYDSIAEKVALTDKPRTFSRAMSGGKKQPYADWVKEYVSGIENIGKKE